MPSLVVGKVATVVDSMFTAKKKIPDPPLVNFNVVSNVKISQFILLALSCSFKPVTK